METLVSRIGAFFPASFEPTGLVLAGVFMYVLLPIVILAVLLMVLWRQAVRHNAFSMRPRWVIAAPISIVLILSVSSGTALAAYNYFAGRDASVEASTAEFLNYGARLRVGGHITPKFTEAMRGVLEGNPLVTAVQLDGKGGGDIAAARSFRDYIRSKGLNTFVEAECIKLCAVIFLGGTRRFITEDAKLGFAAPAVAGHVMERSNDVLRKDAMAVGVSESFAQKAMASDQVVYPTPDELLDGGVVTDVIPPGDEPRF